MQRLYDETIQRTLLKLARHWGGEINITQIHSKVPWFRLEARKKKQAVSGSTCVLSRLRYAQKTVSILHSYTKSECLALPVFIIPAGMAAEIRSKDLPLFGENLPQHI